MMGNFWMLLKTNFGPVLWPAFGYVLINIGNMLTGKDKAGKLGKIREGANRISFTTSRELPVRKLKVPFTKQKESK